MRKSSPDKKTLDAIARLVVKSDLNGRVDVDALISSPDLFRKVTARAAADARDTNVSRGPLTPLLLRRAAALSLSALIVVGAVASTLWLKPGAPPVAAITPYVPDADPVKARPEVPPKPVVSKLSVGRAFETDLRKLRPDPVKAVKKQSNSAPTRLQQPADPAFYAVSFTGEGGSVAGGHIVRVDISRSSLFAMGVNVPLENDSEHIKADLLVGPDGITRGIRFVK